MSWKGNKVISHVKEVYLFFIVSVHCIQSRNYNGKHAQALLFISLHKETDLKAPCQHCIPFLAEINPYFFEISQ